MNRLWKSYSILSAFILFSACGIMLSDEVIRIRIGTNDYEPENKKLLERLRPFNPERLGIDRAANDTLVLFETTGKNILDFASTVPLTWIHFWRPWCPDDNCRDISMYNLGSRANRDKGLFLIMLSESYSLRNIDTIARHSGFLQPICVIDAKTYGTSLKKNRRKFIQELQSGNDPEQVDDDFIFKRDSLIFRGRIESLHQLDSLFKE